MRRLTYIYAILFIMAIVFVVVNCTDEDLVKNGQENMEEFSIQEAKDYFQVQMAENLILSRSLALKIIKLFLLVILSLTGI